MNRIYTLDSLPALAGEFWETYGDKTVFTFSGELGAGKTSFIQALCRAKQVEDLVSSPTFSLINEYRYPGGTIYHMDLYRIKDEEEAIRSGIEDSLYSGAICLVEWPERAPDLFPEGTIHVSLETVDESSRKIWITL
ncbi:MAG TPA: tRNA (adenosine(37)-N6)-threonylcarbamoyltransferase complex ATPase subunit type 1 TsaE [Puia sp.]|nr:tRNA (adenosine(37)-N6)-threonylcarbamoyltransferase complex ATPase subunit type 1 TsaE [Puia sp.]